MKAKKKRTKVIIFILIILVTTTIGTCLYKLLNRTTNSPIVKTTERNKK